MDEDELEIDFGESKNQNNICLTDILKQNKKRNMI